MTNNKNKLAQGKNKASKHKQNNQTAPRFLKLTQDIVFKNFFSRNKQVLISLLKNFLLTDEIADITILNPEIRKTSNNKINPSLSKKLLNIKQNQSKLDFENKAILEKYLNSISFKDSALYPNKLNKKQVVLDLRVKLQTGENINVEMQTVSQEFFLKRILFYWAKLYSQDLEKGDSYNKITPAYSLIFTTFPVLGKEIKDFMSSFSIRRNKEPYQLFNKDLKIVIVEMSKLTKPYDELLDLKEKWCYLLKESSNLTKEDYMYLSKDEEMDMALKHLNKLSRDEILYQEALTEEINRVAYELDRAGLLQKGKIERNEEIALNMLKEGFEVSAISKVTGLSQEEIAKLRK